MSFSPSISQSEIFELSFRLPLGSYELQLQIEYQPVVALSPRGGEVSAYECLLRLDANERVLEVSELISELEQAGTIPELDLMVVDHVCRIAVANPSLRLWVNISQATMGSISTMEKVGSRIISGGLANRVTLEITETVEGPKEQIMNSLRHLYALGISVVIDDIDEQLSMASLLIGNLVSGCKLSRRSMVRLAENTARVSEVLEQVRWCRSHGKSVVLEGVETARDLQIAISLEVNYCQGFHFWPSLPLHEIPAQGTEVFIPPRSLRQRAQS